MKTNRYLLLLWVILGMSSCSSFFIRRGNTNTPVEAFNTLWKVMDENYIYFPYKGINWDSLYKVYRPKVENQMTDEELFNVMRDLIHELKDGHVSIYSNFNVARNDAFYADYPDNFNPAFVERQYLKGDYFTTGPLIHQFIDSIGYIYYESFVNGVENDDLDYVLERFENCKGLILDLRGNTGGNLRNSYKLLGRFVPRKRMVGRSFMKNGKAHNAYSRATEMYAVPQGHYKFTKPIVILTNRKCYSACNFFLGFMSTLPNVTIVGDRTGGGGGMPVTTELPNGWELHYTATYTELPDGFNIEHGVPPDVSVNTGPQDELQGKDALIEKALELLRK